MIKQTGIVRNIDNLGRLVIPKELRRQLDIEDGLDSIEFFIDEDGGLVLRKYQPCCVFCNSMDNLVEYANKLVCSTCIERLSVSKENRVSEETEAERPMNI